MRLFAKFRFPKGCPYCTKKHFATRRQVRAWLRASPGDALAGATRLLPLGSRDGALLPSHVRFHTLLCTHHTQELKLLLLFTISISPDEKLPGYGCAKSCTFSGPPQLRAQTTAQR